MTAPEAKDDARRVRQTTRAQTALAGGRSRPSVLRSERTVLSSTRHASIIALASASQAGLTPVLHFQLSVLSDLARQ